MPTGDDLATCGGHLARTSDDEGEDIHDDALRGVVDAQAEGGDIAGALETAAGIGDAARRDAARAAVAQAAVAAGSAGLVLDAARSATCAMERSWRLRAIARAQAFAGDTTGALATARGIEDASARNRAWALAAIAEATLG